MNTDKEQEYEISLSGDGLNLKRKVSGPVAQTILNLVMSGVATPPPPPGGQGTQTNTGAPATGQPNGSLSPKQFLALKKPGTQVERIACLAYYLTNYRSSPSFKTVELTKLNTEASQPKMANSTYAANDAVKQNYLSQAGGGKKQITARGEAIVEAMPDEEKMKAARAEHVGAKPRRKKNAPKKK